jgi:magnesium transporter
MHKGLSQPQWALLRSFKKGESSNLKRLLPKLKPSEIVQVFARMGKSDQIRMMEMLFELGMARPALKKLPDELTKEILAGISDDTIQEDVRGLSAEETSDLLEYLPAKRQEGILERLDARQRWLVTRERLYDKDSAAGRMTTDYVTFSQEMTAGEVIGELRRRYDKADLHDVYVVDDVDRIKGATTGGCWASYPSMRLRMFSKKRRPRTSIVWQI